MSVAGDNLAKFSSVRFKNVDQSAFLKLTKVFRSLYWAWMLVSQEMTIGRWSEPRAVMVSQLE